MGFMDYVVFIVVLWVSEEIALVNEWRTFVLVLPFKLGFNISVWGRDIVMNLRDSHHFIAIFFDFLWKIPDLVGFTSYLIQKYKESLYKMK